MNHDATGRAVETRLKSAVERVVRPVSVTFAGRRQMREELLAHLRDVYDEEFEQCGDAQEACSRALARFGEPHEVTRQLQGSVPRWNQLLSGLQYVPRPTDFTPLGTLRAMLLLSVAIFGLLVFVLYVLTWFLGLARPIPFYHLGVMSVSCLVFFFPFQLVSEKLGHLSLEKRAFIRWPTLGLLLAAGACIPSWITALYWAMSSELVSGWRVLWPVYLVGPPLGVLLAIIQGRKFVRDKQYSLEWSSVEIED